MAITPRQKAVGKCPVCGKHPTWFNDVPLRAFCWGTEAKPHNEMTRIVPSQHQPYGNVGKTKWVTEKEFAKSV